MKTFVLTAVASLFAISLFAQNQYATTTDGKKVLLKSNGTWEYVKEGATTPSSLYTGGNKPATTNTHTTRVTNSSNSKTGSSTKKATGRTYIRGPRGGCYYINSNGNKTYVDRSFCN